MSLWVIRVGILGGYDMVGKRARTEADARAWGAAALGRRPDEVEVYVAGHPPEARA